jgi:hypothetical protein
MRMMVRDIVAVLGTTGVGKSAYAVELARGLAARGKGGSDRQPGTLTTKKTTTPTSTTTTTTTMTSSPPTTKIPTTRPTPDRKTEQHLPTPRRGVVLSADSMQLYAGLEVITNKVTLDEMRGVEHWGVGGTDGAEGIEGITDAGPTTEDDAIPHRETDDVITKNGAETKGAFRGVRVGEAPWEVGRWAGEAWRKVSLFSTLSFGDGLVGVALVERRFGWREVSWRGRWFSAWLDTRFVRGMARGVGRWTRSRDVLYALLGRSGERMGT